MAMSSDNASLISLRAPIVGYKRVHFLYDNRGAMSLVVAAENAEGDWSDVYHISSRKGEGWFVADALLQPPANRLAIRTNLGTIGGGDTMITQITIFTALRSGAPKADPI